MTNTPAAAAGGRRPGGVHAGRLPEPAREDGPTAASAVQLAIALLTASLDSPELEEWAAWALIPEDPEALADAIATCAWSTCSCSTSSTKQAASRQRPRCRNSPISAAAGPERPSPDS